MLNDKYLIWSYMRCFDHDKNGYGVDEFLEKVGVKPEGIAALVYHPDFVHLHEGMDHEFTVPPQMFGCRKDVRRLPEETYRKYSWTNYQIRGLVDELHKRDVNIYLSIFGVYYRDMFHDEFLGSHKELLMRTLDRTEHLVALKRFKDGTYYEDFFIKKLAETLIDYDMDGVHLGDAFSPLSEPLAAGDYTTDMVEQFIAHTGTAVPENIRASLGDDRNEHLAERQKWIWSELREEWIRFYDWRWTQFYKKLCTAMHKIGKKVSDLGMYISDSIRSMYSMGTDAKNLTDAGVDFFTPNILPTSVTMNTSAGDKYQYNDHPLFHRFMTMIPEMKAHAPNSTLYHMLGIRDEEEEWDVFRHAPNEFERDLFTGMAYHIVTPNGPERCISKHFLTLGDTIEKEDWRRLNKLMTAAYSLDPAEITSPVLYWSEEANYRMLGEYIKTRRPSAAQIHALVQEYGAFCAGVVRSEDIDHYNGPLFIPTFDLISDNEKRDLIEKKRAIVAIAPAEYDISALDISLCLTDKDSNYPHKVFLLNIKAPDDITPFIDALNEKDNIPELPPETELHDENLNVMFEMYMQKISNGFSKAAAMLLKYADSLNNPFTSDSPIMVFKEKDGVYRVYIFSRFDDRYDRALLTANKPMKSAEILGSFPYRPVQFIDKVVSFSQTSDIAKALDESSGCTFQLKIHKSGVAVFRIVL